MSDKGDLETRIADLETIVGVLREAIAGPLRNQAAYFVRHGWSAEEIAAFNLFQARRRRGFAAKGSMIHRYLREMRRTE